MHSITAMLSLRPPAQTLDWFVQSSSSCRSHASVRSLVLVPRLRFHGVCWLPRLPRLQHAYAWLSTLTDGRPVHLNRAAIVVPHRPSKIGLLHPPKTSQGSLAGIKREASILVPGIQQPLWKERLLLDPRMPLLFKSAEALVKPPVHLFPPSPLPRPPCDSSFCRRCSCSSVSITRRLLSTMAAILSPSAGVSRPAATACNTASTAAATSPAVVTGASRNFAGGNITAARPKPGWAPV